MNINYKTRVSAIGRNGIMIQTGLEVLPIGDVPRKVVSLSPLNTRGVGNCSIDIPIDAIPDVIEALRKTYVEQYPQSLETI
jgi:hypothetical protein